MNRLTYIDNISSILNQPPFNTPATLAIFKHASRAAQNPLKELECRPSPNNIGHDSYVIHRHTPPFFFLQSRFLYHIILRAFHLFHTERSISCHLVLPSTSAYPRMSRPMEGYSIQAQTERLQAYCKAKGWGVFHTYTDAGRLLRFKHAAACPLAAH